MPKISPKYVNKIPNNWTQKLSNNKKGIKYVDSKNSSNYIRFSPPNLDPRAPIGQRVPYFQRVKDGKYLTTTGKWVIGSKENRNLYHIPQSMYEKLKPLLDLNN